MGSQPSDKYRTARERRHENLGRGTWLCIALEIKQKGPSQTPPDTLDTHTLFSGPHLLFRKKTATLDILTDFCT